MTGNPAEKPGHTYLLDPEDETEIARLAKQDRAFTAAMGGIFPERSSLDSIHAILDVACGPSRWTRDVARTYPDISIVGIDISTKMIAYAQAQASVQGLNNATFLLMNALEPFTFPDETFDLVNMRAATGFAPRTQWPTLLQHCFRVLRPGGTLRLTEAETVGFTNSLACEKVFSWIAQRLYNKGYGFSPDGSNLGILPMLGLLLQDVGCVNIQAKPYMLDFSPGNALHESGYENYQVLLALLKPALIHEGIATEEQFDETYRLMLEDMRLPRFRGLNPVLTVWGTKPA